MAEGDPVRTSLRLPFTPPLEPSNLYGHLVATGVPGVEEHRGGAYRCALRLAHGPAVVAVHLPDGDAVPVVLHLSDGRDEAEAAARCRHLLDLDVDAPAVDAALAGDPLLRPLVRSTPGRRVPRTLEVEALALRAVLGQQVSTAAARTHAARLVAAIGEPVHDPDGGLSRLFPAPQAVAGLDDAALADVLRMPAVRRRTVLAVAEALAGGDVDLRPGADWAQARERLLALPGVGPWTVATIALRGLGHPDAFLASDLGVRAAARRLGLPDGAAALERASQRWAPWRAYAVQHLWATGEHAVNSLPRDW